MKRNQLLAAVRPFLFIVVGAVLPIEMALSMIASARDNTPVSGAHSDSSQSTNADNDLSAQLQDLKAKTAALEAALMKRYPDAVSKDTSGGNGISAMSGGMGMMGGKGMGMMGGSEDDEMTEMMKTMRTMMEMKMMQMKSKGMGGEMSDMQGAGMGMMGGKGKGMAEMGMMGGKGMGMMGGATNNGMSGMQMPSALPGFPGASHIYHIGATGFFLDHPEHIQLTSEQQENLSGIKEKTMLDQGTTQRKIDEAEQELWSLTSSDQSEATSIDAKVREIETFRGDQRIAFIGAVGEAANVLTPEQRKILVGTLPPNHAADADKQH